MLCPICKKNLEKSIFYHTEVDYCPQCLGIWFEAEELRQAKDEKDETLQWLDIDLWQDEEKFKLAYGIRLCPACRLPMYEVYYGDSGLVVDVCSLCHGIWLDRGEFKKISKYLKKRADYEILHNYSKNLISEFWEIFVGPESFKEELTDFITLLKVLNFKFGNRQVAISQLIADRQTQKKIIK